MILIATVAAKDEKDKNEQRDNAVVVKAVAHLSFPSWMGNFV
jgi:hypothetical protein